MLVVDVDMVEAEGADEGVEEVEEVEVVEVGAELLEELVIEGADEGVEEVEVVEVDDELLEEELLVDVVEVEELETMYIFKRLPPPQYSNGLPAQVIEQPVF